MALYNALLGQGGRIHLPSPSGEGWTKLLSVDRSDNFSGDYSIMLNQTKTIDLSLIGLSNAEIDEFIIIITDNGATWSRNVGNATSTSILELYSPLHYAKIEKSGNVLTVTPPVLVADVSTVGGGATIPAYEVWYKGKVEVVNIKPSKVELVAVIASNSLVSNDFGIAVNIGDILLYSFMNSTTKMTVTNSADVRIISQTTNVRGNIYGCFVLCEVTGSAPTCTVTQGSTPWAQVCKLS